jgi:transcriptional regulator with XRE-family HTH domain
MAANSAVRQVLEMDSHTKNGGPNFLRQWRERAGMSQAELAEVVNTTSSVIHYLETGERALSAKWLRRLAPALDTTPGMILDHDPKDLEADILDIWSRADLREKRQISEIAKTLIKTGTGN